MHCFFVLSCHSRIWGVSKRFCSESSCEKPVPCPGIARPPEYAAHRDSCLGRKSLQTLLHLYNSHGRRIPVYSKGRRNARSHRFLSRTTFPSSARAASVALRRSFIQCYKTSGTEPTCGARSGRRALWLVRPFAHKYRDNRLIQPPSPFLPNQSD